MEFLQDKLLNYYPNFLTKLPETNQYKFVKTLRNRLIELKQTLKILKEEDNLDRPILIWKEQNKEGVYNLHFQVLIDDIKRIEIYRDGEKEELIESFSYSENENKNSFYHIIKDIHTENDEMIPSMRYFIYVSTYEEYEFYKGFPENDYPVSDNLTIIKAKNNDGTYSLNFKTNSLKNIYNAEILIKKENKVLNTYTKNKTNNWEGDYENNPPELLNQLEFNFNKIVESEILENTYSFKVSTCDGINSFGEYKNPKTFILDLEKGKLVEDIYNHDEALDIIGKRLDFPRSKFKLYSGDGENKIGDKEYLKFHENTETKFNNRESEDDYHYMERLKFFCNNLQAHIDSNTIGEDVLSFTPKRKNINIIEPLELVQLEIYKYWGIIPEIINRDKYLVKQNQDGMRGLLCGPGDEGVKVETIVELSKIPYLIVGVKNKLKAYVYNKQTGEVIGRGNIVFKIRYENTSRVETYKVKINNYQAILNFIPKDPGNMNIELVYQGTGKYKRSKYNRKIYVNLVPVKILASNIKTHLNNPYTLKAHLVSTRDESEKIDGTISFKIESKIEDNLIYSRSLKVNTTNGNLNLDYLNEVKYEELINTLDIGTYTVKVEYTGGDIKNNEFQDAVGEFQLKVSETESHLYIHSLFVPPNHISAKVYDEDNTPLEKELKLKYKKVTIDTIKTKPNKYIPFSNLGEIPENLGDLELVFDGDDDYYPTKYQIPPLENIILENTEIIVNKEYKCVLGSNTQIKLKLKSIQGVNLKNKPIYTSINGEELGVYYSDNNGECVINYLSQELGEKTLKLEFRGEDLRYYSTSALVKLNTVDKIKTQLKVNTNTVYVDGALDIELSDENNNKIPYGEIMLIDNTKTSATYGEVFARGITDLEGIAKINFKMTPKYNRQILIKYIPNEEYEETVLELNDFNVVKHPLNINTTPTNNSKIEYSDAGFMIKTRLLDGDTLKEVEGVNVYWEFRKETTMESETLGSVKTNTEGLAEYPIHYAPGEYTYGVIIPATEKYKEKDTSPEEYRSKIEILTNTSSGTGKIKTFEVNVIEDEIHPGEEYTVNIKLIGENNITPTGGVQIYTGTLNEDILTGKQGNPIILEDKGYGIASKTVKLKSNSNINTPQEFNIKGYYLGDENYQKTSSENYTDGIDKIKVIGESTNTKKTIKDFKINIIENTVYPYETYHIEAILEGEDTAPTGKVNFYIHGDKTGKQGEGTLNPISSNISSLTLELKANTTNTGTYTIYGYYEGDNTYDASDSIDYTNGTDTINLITKTNTNTTATVKTTPNLSVQANPNPVANGEDYSIIIQVPKNATGNITILQNGSIIDTLGINNGLASLKLNTKQINPNNGNFTIKYSGDTNYNSNIVEIQILSYNKLIDTSFELLSTKMYKNEKFKIKLLDINKNPIPGYRFNITLTEDGVGSKTYQSEQPTDYEGIGYITPTMVRKNGTKLTLDLSFDGTEKYNKVVKQFNIEYYGE